MVTAADGRAKGAGKDDRGGVLHMTFIISLPFPPSTNVYYRRGKFATYLSPQGRAYKEKVAELVSDYQPAIENALQGRLSAFLSLSAPTRRSFDIDNRVKAVLDALQDAGVYEDDSQFDCLTILRHPVTKGGYCNVVIAGGGA